MKDPRRARLDASLGGELSLLLLADMLDTDMQWFGSDLGCLLGIADRVGLL